jgi:hypothetical protein
MLIYLTNNIRHLIKLSFNTPKPTRGLETHRCVPEGNTTMITGDLLARGEAATFRMAMPL